ncbi:hypothetical protein [Microseira sp. BLCC-F43]|jgi:hypothetical protein|uniref:hypothetical protein n=1 Tax=Microseira sp. BLCC-F43 TaxID=3153602 RepID=UPI0035BB75D6
MWVFSIQMVYGLSIHEVFAILNLTKPFKTPDGVTIPALNDPNNKTNLIIIGLTENLGFQAPPNSCATGGFSAVSVF